jgi:hypothetical protein
MRQTGRKPNRLAMGRPGIEPSEGQHCLSYQVSQFFQSALNFAFGNWHLDRPKTRESAPHADGMIEAPSLMESPNSLTIQAVAGRVATHLHRLGSALDFGPDMQEKAFAALIPTRRLV